MGKLEGKVALITGAGSGIGRAMALLFGEEGAKVVVADRVVSRARETAGMVNEAGGEAMFIRADVSSAASVQRMVGATVDRYGRVDILCNNAGIFPEPASTTETTEKDWDRVFGTNLKGVFLGSKYAIPVMVSQGGGVIVNTASSAGLVGSPGICAYGASKAAIIQLTKTMAAEYAKEDIRVNCICPGGILTPMTEGGLADATFRQAVLQGVPLGRFGKPDEIARAALYLASGDSSYATGVALVADGGATTI